MNSRYILLGLLVVVGLVLTAAGGGNTQRITNATNQVKTLLCDLLPLVIFIALVFGALLYAISQVLPSEQKARVGQFAGAALVTGIFAALVYLVGPFVLSILIPSQNQNFTCGY
ncbi:MAG: hypothetical protein N3C61_03060 [Candidatus Micrarchaeota archaeon]|nr:hypothetical protein [Candidatus Micrarchaeota archaeon]